MEKSVNLVILSVSLLGLCLCHSSLKVYYVKPAGPSSSSSSECPSSSLPCHSLQYYVSHSNFTNNSLFLFLPGEHHLDSVVDISKVANLSLEGVNSGVKILCNSFPSGFNIREFTGLSIKNMSLSHCIQSDQVALHLESGSEVNVDSISFSDTLEFATGLKFTSVTGSLKVSNSLFLASQSYYAYGLIVNYVCCINQPSYFIFSNNEVQAKVNDSAPGLLVHINCSHVHMLIDNSVFTNSVSVDIYFCVLTNISVTVSNSSFFGIDYILMECVINNAHCLMTLSQVTAEFLSAAIHTTNCTFAIQNSLIDQIYVFNDSRQSTNETLLQVLQVVLRNVTVTDGFWLSFITVLIANCTFENCTESAIRATSSKLFFQGYNVFRNNSASIGAGIQLIQFSYMFLQSHTYILFENNHADFVGGAIYTDSQEADPCFFHVVGDSPSDIEINFVNNSADNGGSSLYGNNIANCNNLHKYFSNISNTESIPSAIASDPYKVCFCEDGRNQPRCSDFGYKDVEVFPGEKLFFNLAVVSHRLNGIVTGVIRAYLKFNRFSDYSPPKVTLGPSQNLQIAHKPHCEYFTYTINSAESKKTFILQLTPDLRFLKSFNENGDTIGVTVLLLNCPIGFILSAITGKCECGHMLKKGEIVCDINTQSIVRPANTWIGFLNLSDMPEAIFHPHCPIGYCLPYNTNITSNNSDSQCAPHRTGLLCGKCEEGYSLTLGNGTCATCSNTYLMLILPLAASGLLLIAILFALNLTVTEGTINGLIFYANVIGMNHSTLYSGEENWLYTFLALLNLDLGIATCFYDGMDGYAETWLQFIFPIYLWMIVLVIIEFYSIFPTLANRLGGRNAVKVLATLLILSYTKLQRTVVTIMSFTILEYPDGSIHYVWLYDANIDYFKGKHFYLGLAGIFALVFFILPYTLCLVFFQQLQACSNHIPFRWVNKFKPIFDAYAGPYKDKYRFWTGMLLLIRTILIILFTANTSGSVDFNLLIILIISLALALANSNGTYKKWPLNYLEVFFYIQLGVFAGGIMYARHNSGNVFIIANISICLCLAVFLFVIGHHCLLHYKALKCYCYRLMGYAEIVEDGDVSLTHERFVN